MSSYIDSEERHGNSPDQDVRYGKGSYEKVGRLPVQAGFKDLSISVLKTFVYSCLFVCLFVCLCRRLKTEGC